MASGSFEKNGVPRDRFAIRLNGHARQHLDIELYKPSLFLEAFDLHLGRSV